MSVCPKIRYRDELAAKIALANTQRAKSSKRDERRAYRCPDCAGFHLTSKGKGKR